MTHSAQVLDPVLAVGLANREVLHRVLVARRDRPDHGARARGRHRLVDGDALGLERRHGGAGSGGPPAHRLPQARDLGLQLGDAVAGGLQLRLEITDLGRQPLVLATQIGLALTGG
jgi:hypothetical protein